MAKFHINKEGNAGRCSATAGKCPFGGAEEHYKTIEDARRAVENQYMEKDQMSANKNTKETQKQKNREISESLDSLTNHSASFESDTFAIAGIESWAGVAVSGESDLVMSIARMEGGEVRAGVNYGAADLLSKHQPIAKVFNENDFIWFLADSENFKNVCTNYDCDKWGDDDCLEHTDRAGAKEAWKIIEKEVLPRYI